MTTPKASPDRSHRGNAQARQIVRKMRQTAAAAVCLTAVAAATSAACSSPPACTLIGMPSGVSVTVDSSLADAAATATVEVCDKGVCHTAPAPLLKSTKPGTGTGDGRSTGIRLEPINEKSGFAAFSAQLTAEPTEVTVTVRDTAEKVLTEQQIRATPRLGFPNGPDCSPDGPQIALRISQQDIVVTLG
jgi:hypothetical protein